MKKKFYLFIFTLCSLSLTISSFAQDRVWGINPDSKLYSSNADGSDVRIVELDPSKFGEYVERLIKLENGNLVFITGNGGTFDYGVISTVTPEGIVPLYPIDEYASRFERTLSDGRDGYLYALRGSIFYEDFPQVFSFKIDGSEQRSGIGGFKKLINREPLTVMSDGIYGTSSGQQADKGFIFKLDKQKLVDTKDIFFYIRCGR